MVREEPDGGGVNRVEYKRESRAEYSHTHMDDMAGDVCVCMCMCVLCILGYCMCDYYNTIKSVID